MNSPAASRRRCQCSARCLLGPISARTMLRLPCRRPTRPGAKAVEQAGIPGTARPGGRRRRAAPRCSLPGGPATEGRPGGDDTKSSPPTWSPRSTRTAEELIRSHIPGRPPGGRDTRRGGRRHRGGGCGPGALGRGSTGRHRELPLRPGRLVGQHRGGAGRHDRGGCGEHAPPSASCSPPRSAGARGCTRATARPSRCAATPGCRSTRRWCPPGSGTRCRGASCRARWSVCCCPGCGTSGAVARAPWTCARCSRPSRVNAYYERGVNYWDWAAGGLVATEAGAVLGGLAGRPASSGMTIAAEPELFVQLRNLLGEPGRGEGRRSGQLVLARGAPPPRGRPPRTPRPGTRNPAPAASPSPFTVPRGQAAGPIALRLAGQVAGRVAAALTQEREGQRAGTADGQLDHAVRAVFRPVVMARRKVSTDWRAETRASWPMQSSCG